MAGCSSQTTTPAPTESTANTVEVRATDSTCALSSPSANAGPLTFAVRNDSTDPVTFKLSKADGVTVVGELAAIEPGLTQDLSLEAEQGAYVAACLPAGDTTGIKSAFTVQ